MIVISLHNKEHTAVSRHAATSSDNIQRHNLLNVLTYITLARLCTCFL